MLAPLALGGTWRAIIAEVERRINGGRPSLLEELAARAWPAGESERVDGWLLRRTPSVTRRRLNSALPMGRDGAALEDVERFYRGHGMTPLVQVAPAEDLGELDVRIPPPAAFAVAFLEGSGVARAVLGALAEWSREHGAGSLYLQVERDNAAARALYASLGFVRSHGYHFRVAPG
jgi:GNAT superfamily N-acetyltransferase